MPKFLNNITENGDGVVSSPDNSVQKIVTVSKASWESLLSANALVAGTIYNVEEEEDQISATTEIPLGGAVVFYGPTSKIPGNFMEALGQSLSTIEYSELFSIIGYTFGGSGTNFNLPNMRKNNVGYTPVQNYAGHDLGSTWGSETHTLTEAELAAHKHEALYGSSVSKAPLVDIGVSDTSFGLTFNTDGGYKAKPGYMQTKGDNEAHNNMQPSFAVRFIIKVKEEALTNDLRNLDIEVSSLIQKYNTLQSSYNSLVSSYNSVAEDYEDIEANYNSINSSLVNINSSYNAFKALPHYAGEYILFEGDTLITNNSTFQRFGYAYYVKSSIATQFPDISGYTKSYKLKCEYTDNITTTTHGVYVKFVSSSSSSIVNEFVFPYTWGGTDNFYRRSAVVNITQAILDRYTYHIDIQGTPTFSSTGKSVRYYKLSILVYYEEV